MIILLPNKCRRKKENEKFNMYFPLLQCNSNFVIAYLTQRKKRYNNRYSLKHRYLVCLEQYLISDVELKKDVYENSNPE